MGERFSLLDLLPMKGNFKTLNAIKELKEKLSFTEEEVKYFDIKQQLVKNGAQLATTWDVEKAQEEKEFEIGNLGKELIEERLGYLNKEEKLEERHFSLYKKFIEE